MTAILPERMTAEERAHLEELVAKSFMDGFSALLNPELAKQMAKLAIEKVIVFQGYTGKQL